MKKDLLTFDCSINPDVQDFIRYKAINYEKRALARTYLIVDADSADEESPGIMAFFSIGISHMLIRNEVPKKYKRKLNVMLRKPTVPCYVLGQLGKNEDYWNDIDGVEIISYAMQFLVEAFKIVGGSCVRIDCKDEECLKSFYSENGFEFVQVNIDGDLLQYIRMLN